MDTVIVKVSSAIWSAYTSMPSLPAGSSSEDEPSEVDPTALRRLQVSRPLNSPARPRILCLHGRGSNNDITQFQMVHTRLAQHCDCDLLHAPHPDSAYSSDFHLLSQQPFYAWWFGEIDGPRLARVLRRVLRYIERFGPYDGCGCPDSTAAVAASTSGTPLTAPAPRLPFLQAVRLLAGRGARLAPQPARHGRGGGRLLGAALALCRLGLWRLARRRSG